MQFDDVVLGRRSIRGYKRDPVPRALIREVIEMAMRAPSSLNTQPWNFYVVAGAPLDRIRAGNTERNLAGVPDSREFRGHGAYVGEHRERQIEIAKQLFGAMGIERHDRVAIWRGLRALVVGFLIAIVVTFVFSLFIRLIGHTPEPYREGVRPVSELINSPDLFSVIIAVVAGIIGVVSLTEARAGALIGVFISVTTIPAAADIGLSVAFQSWRAARGSTFQLLLNVVLLILVGVLALRVQRLVWRDRGPRS